MAFPWFCCQQDLNCGFAVRYVFKVVLEAFPRRRCKAPRTLRQGDVSCVASVDGENAWKALPDSAGKNYFLLHFLLFIPSPPFSFSIFTSTGVNSRKLKCILQWRMFCLAWSKAALYISGQMLNTHNVPCFLVFKAKFFYHCLRI